MMPSALSVPFPELSAKQRATMLTLGKNWVADIHAGRQQVCAIYDAIHSALPADGVRTVRDRAYGDDPRQRLDLYLPPESHQATVRPIVAFVHGGGFVRGNKDVTSHLYANVPRLFARAGCIGANIEYRLAHQAAYPAGEEDVAAALAWLRQHASQWGGDAERVVLIGHSSGGSHVANTMTNLHACTSGVTAVVLISARLDADTHPDNPNAAGVTAYYGADADAQRRRAPLAQAHALAVPLMVAWAQYENPYLDMYALQYAARVAGAGRTPRVVQVPWHNHTSIVAHLGCADGDFTNELLHFVMQHTTAPPAACSIPQ